ncbi:STAS domain-containing protein [Streptomyces cyaneofuscatus]|uniref:STAS domain-containing protein n=1 Tax=Streptomyces cyaneofuscatus TaxID=66883 RepID=UPI0033A4DCD5
MFRNEAALSMCTSSASGTLSPERSTVDTWYSPQMRQYECRGAWVIIAAGEFDLGSITPLQEALHTAARQYPKVVLEASAVTFADSTLLNLLILTHRMGTLRVVAPSPQIRRLCEITGVDSVLEIRRTIDEAAAS